MNADVVVKDYQQLAVSRTMKSLRSVACTFAVVALVGSAVSAVYSTLHRDAVRQNTCHWTMGEHHDATLKCTRELAVCEVSPYLVKPNLSEQAIGSRQKACGQLVRSCSIDQPVTWRLTSDAATFAKVFGVLGVFITGPCYRLWSSNLSGQERRKDVTWCEGKDRFRTIEQ